MPTTNNFLMMLASIFALSLICSSCDQPSGQTNDPTPTPTPTPTPAPIAESQIKASLIRKAATLNSGRAGDEEWCGAEYTITKVQHSDNAYAGAIFGMIRRFTDNKITSILSYKAWFDFTTGTWTLNHVTGTGIMFSPVHFLTESELSSEPDIDATVHDPKGFGAQTVLGMSRQLAYLHRQIENRQRVANSYKIFDMSSADRSAIQKKLEVPTSEPMLEADPNVKEHVISWDEIDSFNHSTEKTSLQQSEEWKLYEGSKVNWKGIIEDTSNELVVHTIMNSSRGESNVYVACNRSQQSKALDLRKGDGIEYSAKLSGQPTRSNAVYLDDGVIIALTSKEQLEREANETRRQKELADQAERERLKQLAASPTPATSSNPVLTVADAQREAMRRYPELGVAGSRFNAIYIELYTRYRQERPEYFSDPSWPITLAEHVSSIVVPGLPLPEVID